MDNRRHSVPGLLTYRGILSLCLRRRPVDVVVQIYSNFCLNPRSNRGSQGQTRVRNVKQDKIQVRKKG